MEDQKEVFITKAGIIHEIDPSYFWVFIDETGNELLKDEQYPVFGMGGCAVLGRFYYSELVNPWQALKEKYFGGKNAPLHACELRNPIAIQLEALNHFFQNYMFSRIASVVSDLTIYETPIQIGHFQLVARVLLNRILEVAKYFDFKEIVIVYEDSERLNRLAHKYLSGYIFSINRRDFNFHKKPLIFRMQKSEGEIGLEIADFIVHTAGRQVKANRKGQADINSRRDFMAIFKDVDQRLVGYDEIMRVT